MCAHGHRCLGPITSPWKVDYSHKPDDGRQIKIRLSTKQDPMVDKTGQTIRQI
ncbi:ATP-binding protein, partial [Mycobacterium tuberculosis]